MSWVVFDFGGVIGATTTALPTLAERMGADPERFAASYWSHRDGYDGGESDEWFWRVIASDCGVGGLDPDTSVELTELDIAGWLHLRTETTALLAELDQAGARLALLSNAPCSFGRVAEAQAWARHFQHLVFSGDLGLVKPDARIYAKLTERLAARPEECLFFDDRADNVAGAQRAGLRAARWTGADAARELLADYL